MSGREFRLAIDWAAFESVEVVEEVPLEIAAFETGERPGTEVDIRELTVRIGRREVLRLARSLLLLADPFSTDAGSFKPVLVAPEFEDLEARVRASYFELADYHLTAELDVRGQATARVTDRSGRQVWGGSHDAISRRGDDYEAPVATFELWAFILESSRLANSNVTLGAIKAWLEVVGGVHLYHRNLRVPPYGDPGHDWLDMNLSRVRSPEARPSTNNSLGRVVVQDPTDLLLQKTDRTGFVESEAFGELKRFATDVLEWLATERLREAEARRQSERPRASKRVETARRNLERVITALPQGRGEVVERAVTRLERARDEEVKTLHEDLQLYRTLSTVGTTAAVFAHESAKPAGQILKLTDVMETRARRVLGADYEGTLARPVALTRQAAQFLATFAEIPLRLLDRGKRRWGRVHVVSATQGIVDLMSGLLSEVGIQVDVATDGTDPIVRGSVASIEAILANLLTNAMNAFASTGSARATRTIRINVRTHEDTVILQVGDNGPGISGIPKSDIWLPGRTTRPGGTGLGLTIVRDTALDLGGTASLVEPGSIGGAEFHVELPLVGSSK